MEPPIKNVNADLGTRRVTIVHDDGADIAGALTRLNLGACALETTAASESDHVATPTRADETRTLKIVLVINAAMFLGEVIGAILADSSALLADSLDMFADAAVYGIALLGVHRARTSQRPTPRPWWLRHSSPSSS